MTAEQARKRTERVNLKTRKMNEKLAIHKAMQKIKDTSGHGGTACVVWVAVGYIQNVKDYFDKRGYRTEIKNYQEWQSSNELCIKWGRQEEK